MAKKGNKKAKRMIKYEDLKKLQELLKVYVKESYGTEARFVDDDEYDNNNNEGIEL